MSRPSSKWINKKHPKKFYTGNYEKTKKDERVLVLTHRNEQDIVVDKEIFESHEKAKDAKWKKIK